MKRILSLAAIAMFGVGLLGCRAEVDTTDHDGHSSTYRKTTTVQPDGDRTVKTETRVDR